MPSKTASLSEIDELDNSTIMTDAANARTHQWLSNHKIDYNLQLIDLSAIDRDAAEKTQARSGPVAGLSDQYAQRMDNGAIFPTIVVQPTSTRRYTVHDGYHRYEAHLQRAVAGRGPQQIQMFVLSKRTPAHLTGLLAMVANWNHGEPVSNSWLLTHALSLVGDNRLPIEVVAKELGVSLADLAMAQNIKSANDRGQRLIRADWFDAPLDNEGKKQLNCLEEDDVFIEAFKAVFCRAIQGTDHITEMVHFINQQNTHQARLELALAHRCGSTPRNKIRSTAGVSSAETRLRSAVKAMKALTTEDVRYLLSAAENQQETTETIRGIVVAARDIDHAIVVWQNQHSDKQ